MFRKKLNFWRLAFISAALVILTLMSVGHFSHPGNRSPMDASMGNMMKKEHAAGIGIYDLFGAPETSPQMEQMHEHHRNQSGLIVATHVLTTGVILVLLPLMVAGTIILAIAWIK